MFVYKYLKKEHLLEFKEKGSIFINTLHNLRSAHEGIRDEFEGRLSLRIEPKKEPLNLSSELAHNYFPSISFQGKCDNAFKAEIGASVISNKEVTNAYVFCTSLKLDKRLFKKWDYNAYYTIINPFQFAEIMYRKLDEEKLLEGCLLDVVKYEDKVKHITNKNKNKILRNVSNDFYNICFTKPKKFRDENEFRIVFVPKYSKEIKKHELICPELRKYCAF